jgi:hypothetical protein
METPEEMELNEIDEEQQIKELACIICNMNETFKKQRCPDCIKSCYTQLNLARRVWKKGYRKIDMEKLTMFKQTCDDALDYIGAANYDERIDKAREDVNRAFQELQQ